MGRFYKGESTSEVGLQAGLRRDLWTAVEPDTSQIEPARRDGRPEVPQRRTAS